MKFGAIRICRFIFVFLFGFISRSIFEKPISTNNFFHVCVQEEQNSPKKFLEKHPLKIFPLLKELNSGWANKEVSVSRQGRF